MKTLFKILGSIVLLAIAIGAFVYIKAFTGEVSEVKGVRIGSYGKEVKEVQRILNGATNYSVVIDGFFDKSTEMALFSTFGIKETALIDLRRRDKNRRNEN